MSTCSVKDFADVSMDKVEAFWNARPCNIRHSLREVGSREYFDDVEARKYFVEPHIPPFAQFERWKDKKVLEVGCGIGTDTINFARAGAKVTAIDYSEKSLDIARRRAEVYGLDIDFYKANAEDISRLVPVEDYDLVYSFGVIHHTPRPRRVVSEIRKWAELLLDKAATTTEKKAQEILPEIAAAITEMKRLEDAIERRINGD